MSDARWAITENTFYRNSDAYRWLRSQHDDISAFLKARCGSFSHVLAEINKDGIKGAHGQPLTYKALLSVWSRVRRDVARDHAVKPLVEAIQEPPDVPGPIPPADPTFKYH